MDRNKLLELLQGYFTILGETYHERLKTYCIRRLGLDACAVEKVLNTPSEAEDDILMHLLYFFSKSMNLPDNTAFLSTEIQRIQERLYIKEKELLKAFQTEHVMQNKNKWRAEKICRQMGEMHIFSGQTIKKGFLEMEESDVVYIVSHTPGKYYDYVSLRAKAIQEFAIWADKQNCYTGKLHKTKIKQLADGISLCDIVKEQIIKDPAALCACLSINIVYPLSILGTAVSVLAYIGMGTQNMLKIKNEDVDLQTGRIQGWEIPAPLELLPVLRSYYETREFTISDTREKLYADDLGFFLHRLCIQNSKHIGKPLKSQDLKNALVQLDVNLHAVGAHAIPVKISGLQISGTLYRLFCREKANGKLVREDYLDAFSLSPATTNTLVSYKERLYADYKQVFWQ